MPSKGWRIRVNGVYLLDNSGKVRFFKSEEAARENLRQTMLAIHDKMKAAMRNMLEAAQEKAASPEQIKELAEVLGDL